MNNNRKRINIWSRRLLKISLIILTIVGLIFWLRYSPVTVIEHQISRGPMISEVLGTGTLEARVSTRISPKISGRIKDILVDQGDRVQKGELLVRLDDDELKQQVAIAQAQVEASAAAIDRLKTDRDRSNAVFEQATKSHSRIASLFEKSAASQAEVDQSAEALAIAIAGVSQSEAAIIEGKKELITAEKTLAYQRARLQDAEIKAPFGGIVVKRTREPGDVAVPGSTILSVIATDELWISAWVDETEIAHLSSEQPARVLFRSEPHQTYAGKVTRLGLEADRETREFIVDVGVLELPHNWAVGQRAEVYIKTAEKKNVIQLPTRFLKRVGGEDGVYINRNGIAFWQPVEVGLRNRDAVEVLSGLKTGDSVVAATDLKTGLKNNRRIITP
ncbi:efflux RND transporter periplasmic adaptor subunit [Gimesia chilikensis]|uniref:efflux RND transporter periplasmic adaptor subunit n=1 Tax=Gimesia chilikensis TaxID=2605989 RepID=UPI00118AFD93|nr:efflux RND transporter periplasmic adaptor subunit [Gimesia chilikensis]QDT87366.1 Macrolide export protein MacA [Gimesia chilikensis]